MTFLTIFPVARNLDRGPMDLSNSRAFYPAVGLLMGLLLVGIEAAAKCLSGMATFAEAGVSEKTKDDAPEAAS